MRTENRPPSAATNRRGKKLPPATSSAITVTIPALAVDGWTLLTVDFPTGLAPITGLVQIAFPSTSGLRLCDATVIAQDRIRFHVANHGKRATSEQELTIQFHPWVRRRSLMPEVNFDSLKDVQL